MAKRPVTTGQLLTLAQAAKAYGYSSDYLRRLAERGRLKAQKIGHQWLTTSDDVEAFIVSREPRGVYKKNPQRRKS